MKARDVMVAPAITASPDSSIKSVAETFVRRRISAVPVVDGNGAVVGIVRKATFCIGPNRRRKSSAPGGLPRWWIQTRSQTNTPKLIR